MENKSVRCKNTLEYESLYLRNELGAVMSRDLSHHLYTCTECQRFVGDIDGMYSSILSETTYPISNKLLDFACKVSPYKSVKGLFTCSQSHLFNKNDQKIFKTHKLFIQNRDDKAVRFDSFAQQMSRHSLSIRTLTDPAIDCLLIFFWSRQHINFTKWSLTIPGIIEDYTISSSGTVIIPSVQIDDMQNKKLYFKKIKLPEKTKMVNKIQDCLLV